MSIKVLNVLRVVRHVLGHPTPRITLRVKENRVVNRAIPAKTTMSACSLPDNLVRETFRTEDLITDDFQIVASGRIAVEIQRASRLQHPMKLKQSRSHHHEVSHDIVLAKHDAERVESFGHLPRYIRTGHHQLEFVLSLGGPVPSVIEGFDLSLRGPGILLPK